MSTSDQKGVINRAFKDSYENLHYNDKYPADDSNIDTSFEILTEKTLQEKFSYKKFRSDNAFKSAAHYIAKYYKPSGNCMKNYFFQRFPFFEWILSYDIKLNLIKDLIAGLTVKNLFILLLVKISSFLNKYFSLFFFFF
jgi:hypothetical protein